MRFLKLRYSLRTFLVVIAFAALVAGWFGYYLHLKSQRQALLAAIEAQGGEYLTYADAPPTILPYVQYVESLEMLINPPRNLDLYLAEKPETQQQISRVLVWLGDPPVRFIRLLQPNPNTSELQEVTALFPEATVKISKAPNKTPHAAELTDEDIVRLRELFRTAEKPSSP